MKMHEFQEARKRVSDSLSLFTARLNGFAVIESEGVKQSEVIVDRLNRCIYIYKPTEIQRIVRLGVREAHPWFKDPLDLLKLV